MSLRVTEVDLLKYNFDCSRLRLEGGFDAIQLKAVDFDASELKKGMEWYETPE